MKQFVPITTISREARFLAHPWCYILKEGFNTYFALGVNYRETVKVPFLKKLIDSDMIMPGGHDKHGREMYVRGVTKKSEEEIRDSSLAYVFHLLCKYPTIEKWDYPGAYLAAKSRLAEVVNSIRRNGG